MLSIFGAAILGTDVIVIPLTSLLMEKNPWWPVLIGDAAFVCALATICLTNAEAKYAHLLKADTDDVLDEIEHSWKSKLVQMFHSKIFLILCVSILCNALVSGIPDLLVIYADKRLGWKVSKVRSPL